MEQIIKKSPIYIDIQKDTPKEFTPYEQYIKLLQIKFGDIVDKTLGQQIESYLPANIHKLEYQVDAVKRCLSGISGSLYYGRRDSLDRKSVV